MGCAACRPAVQRVHLLGVPTDATMERCSQQASACQASCCAVHSLSPGGSIKVLSALDDDQVGRRVDAPGQRGGGHQNLKFRGEIRSPPQSGRWARSSAADGHQAE